MIRSLRFAVFLLLVQAALASSALAQTLGVTATTAGLSVSVTGATSNTDWVTIVPAGSDDRLYTGIWFMSGTSMPPYTLVPAATFIIPAPETAGTYEVRLLAAGRYGRLATVSLTVSGGGIGIPQPPPPPAGNVLLVNGDSNTANDYVSGAQNWAYQVAVGLGLSLDNIAVSGKYSDGIVIDLPVMQVKRASVCMVMIGGNNMAASVYWGTPTARATLDYYLGQMRTVVSTLTASCGKVVILSPPFTLHPMEVARYDAWIVGLRELTAEYHAKFIDVYGHMKALAAMQSQAVFEQNYLVPSADKWHLSPAGHAIISAYVLEQSRR